MRVRDGLGRRLAFSLRSKRLRTSRRIAPARPRAELDAMEGQSVCGVHEVSAPQSAGEETSRDIASSACGRGGDGFEAA
jgi:hypothetical protein